MNWILWWDWPYVLFDINYLLMLGTDWLFGINCLIKLGTDCNYFLGNINYCFIWNEFSDNIGNVWNQLYNKIKHWLVWIIWQKVLLGINSLITLLRLFEMNSLIRLTTLIVKVLIIMWRQRFWQIFISAIL